MKIKITVLILFLLSTASVIAQTSEEVYNKKITTEDEFERIYGKILGQ
ncbi:MAG: hypothetical protein GY936_05225, partial [Ignavibacteriae bacterium]|nr:hypothetical protein [Ignavibacteriota bacterium]